jgi:CRP-like cAMP-binding protein
LEYRAAGAAIACFRDHSATATALTRVETAVLAHEDLAELARLRPDIGLLIYKNLAWGLGAKLKRFDLSLTHDS